MKNFYKLGAYIVIFSLLASCTKSDDNLPEPEKAQTTAPTTTASIDTSKTAVDSTDSKLVIESTGTSTTGTTKPSISSSHFHHHHHTPTPKPTTPKPTTPVTTTPKPTTPTTTPKPTTPVTTTPKPTTPTTTPKPTTPVTTTPKPTTPTTTPKPTTPVTTTPKPTTPTTTPKPTTPVTTTPKPTTPTTTPKPTTPVTTTPKPTTPTTTPKPTTPVTTTPKPTTPVATKPTTSGSIVYKVTAPINLYNKSNITISGDSIAGGTLACIQLVNCTNIHITHCKLGNSKSYGILIANSSNILVDSNFITKVSSGLLAVGCPNGSLRVLANQILNTQGPYPMGAGIQFSGVSGGNNHIENNRIQNVVGQCDPEDKISLYKSNGLPGDPITVKGNWILGSGTSTTSCGITLGDQGGSYEVAQDNIIVNSGAGGAQIAGGTYISIINNSIYSAAFPWSHAGILCANYSGQPSNNLTISGNKVNWTSGNPNDQYGGSTSRVFNAGNSLTSLTTTIIGAATNILGANINASILPSSIITFK